MSRKKKLIPEVGQEVECFCCDSKRYTPWLYPFEGYVKEVYDKSAMVVIRTTHPDDDYLVTGYHGKTIVPFTEMRAVEC
ncbi:hypothetical protein EGW69_13840 [Enterococcus faecium]|uniref:hypothetical protein n=1 Tax=Enterococcus faecium TaxID=1352 RepID=UPI000F4FC5FF|nr:hypothetical protein [Enterococcus faecium]ROY77336.1 hypothetical protein EGW71_14060 [Enterococcus faecium]ROY77357.1 hypothetical protein EGW72_14060 [Enterococcus faecium]ROY79198.1 hypothetical protein EGW69_13840 [Enterococcus faecium]ROY87725.1 hypothetical protein EGX10_13840 [Enterococcus faecium]